MLTARGRERRLLDRAAEPLLLAGEIAARQFYWRAPWLVALARRRSGVPRAAVADRTALREALRAAGVVPGALVMLHSSIAGLALRAADGGVADNPLSVGSAVLRELDDLLGPLGTLTMPSHPHYPDDPGFMRDKSRLVLRYDPDRTASRVGFLTELFRRKSGTRRSLHPLSSLACRGPLADELLRDNLNDERPLPHGTHSAYHRFCRRGGVVVSLGVPLIKSITALHVAEELRDADWPVPGFFYERTFVVRGDGEERPWVVRERRPEFVRSLALQAARRDLIAEGILTERTVCGVRVDRADALPLLEYMLGRNRRSSYPYVLARLARP